MKTVLAKSQTLNLTAVLVLLGLSLCCPRCMAQSGAGSIQGTITDSTGAVIPGAAVHVVNNATGVFSDAKSNNAGFYQVPDLFTATYTVTVTSSGMKTSSQRIELLTARAAVVDISLVPGAVTEHVEVKADLVQLTTTDSGVISNTLDNARINDLPMNGRQLETLAGMTTPGLDGGGQRANGLMNAALDYVADGVVMTDRQFGGENEGQGALQGQSILPDPDSIQEVQIQTVTTGAQYEAPATAVITTKSGTNALHGSAFETTRNNSVLGNARSRSLNYILPHLVRNEFGASAGGPVIIPHFYNGKNKTFWFFAYERFSLSQSSPENVTVPSTGMRTGDFSGLYNGAGQLQQLYNSQTTASSPSCAGNGGIANTYCRTAFVNNQIPMTSLSPFGKVLLDITPKPSTTANPLLTSNLSVPNLTFEVVPTITFRLDQTFTEKNKAYLRFTRDNQELQNTQNGSGNQPQSIAADGLPAGMLGVIVQPNVTIGSALGYTHLFSSSFFAETIAAMEWAHQGYGEAGSGVGAPDVEAQLGLPNNFGEGGFPGVSGGVTTYQTNQGAYGLGTIISSIDENLTKIHGRHQIQFGGRFRHERDFNFNHQSNDAISFSNQTTALEDPNSGSNLSPLANTGNANADLFLGGAGAYTAVLQAPNTHSHQNAIDGYVQDNFHVSERLTLNLGLRWEDHIAPWVKGGVLTSFDLANDAPVLSAPIPQLIANGYTTTALIAAYEALGIQYETPQQAGMPSGLIDNYPWEFAPRIGAAWQLFGAKAGTVLRGGYGRYLYPIPTRNSFYNNTTNNGPYRASYQENFLSASQSPDGLANYPLRKPQTIIAGVNSSNVVSTTGASALTPGQGFYAVDPHFKPATVDEVNATVEQRLWGNSALRVSWVYTHGSNLDLAYYVNQHPTGYTWEMQTGLPLPTGTYASSATGPYDQKIWGAGLIYQEQNGWSNDNNLQVSYQRLYHNGSAFQISAVRSKAFRVGGNSTRDGLIDTAQSFINAKPLVGTTLATYGTVGPVALPPARPTGLASYADWRGLDVYEEYKLDTAIPVNHITFNGIIDVPVGRGKRFLGNANRFVNELAGGFQLAGDGNIASQNMAITATNWGPNSVLHLYKHAQPVQDCRSGTCIHGFEWFNGYLAPTVASGHTPTGCTLAANNVQGLPSDWTPYKTPIDNDCNPADAAYKYYGQNEVQVQASTLNGGAALDTPYAPGTYGINPYSRKIIAGPMNWTADLSVFKVFPITEKVVVRINADAFNVFNIQGFNNPDPTTGIEIMQSSYNTPRQIQLTGRITF
jgi:hypothetical protein